MKDLSDKIRDGIMDGIMDAPLARPNVSDPGDAPVVVSEVLVDCPYCKRINTVSIVNDGEPHYVVCAQCDVAFAVTVRSVDAVVQKVALVEDVA